MNKSPLLLLLLTVLIALLATMPSQIYSGDPSCIRASTVSLLNTGELAVPDEIAASSTKGQYFFQNPVSKKWYPKYGVLNTLMYIPPLAIERALVGKLRNDWQQPEHRVLVLNLYNILLALVIAYYLYLLTGLFSQNTYRNAAFVLVVFFGTFTWNYLRAQTIEVFHLLFLLGGSYHLTRFSRTRRKNQIVYAFLLIALLALSKLVYAPLLGAVAAVGIYRAEDRKKITFLIICLLTLLLGILGYANWNRFGSPFTTGYAQWSKEKNFLSGDMISGLYGFLTDPQKSILIYFSPLLFSLLYWKKFYGKFRGEAIIVLITSLSYLLINSSFINWRGDWCFGPRYLLALLPLASLPLLLSNRTVFSMAIIGAILFGWAQSVVNSVNFHSTFYTWEIIRRTTGIDYHEYFAQPQWSVIRDLDEDFPPFEDLKRRQLVSKPDFNKISQLVELHTARNYYLQPVKLP